MKRKRIVKCVLVAAMAAIGCSGVALARPLAGELQAVVTEHPSIKAARKTLGAAEYSITSAKSGWYPKVSLSTDAGKEKIETAASTDLDRRKPTLTVEQNLFSGGRTTAGIDVAQLDLAMQENGFNSTLQNVLLEGITAYLQVVRYRTLIAIAQRNEATTARQLNLEDVRVERGGGIAVDVLQAKTRLQVARERRVFYEQTLRDAEASYRQVFGHAVDLATVQDVDLPVSRLPTSLEEAMKIGHETNPSLREALLQTRKAGKALVTENAGMYPSVDLVALKSNERNVSQVARRDETSLLLKLNWNLFSGFDTTSRRDAASLQHGAMLDREVVALRKMEESLEVSWNQLVNGRERHELLENAVSISYEVMRNRKRLRDAGKETAINVLDSEVEYYSVLSNKINASYDTRLSGFRLLSAMGALTPATLGLMDGKFAIPVKPLALSFEVTETQEGAAAQTTPAK